MTETQTSRTAAGVQAAGAFTLLVAAGITAGTLSPGMQFIGEHLIHAAPFAGIGAFIAARRYQ